MIFIPFYSISNLRSKLDELGVRLDKNKGQCYLIDQNIVQFILKQAELNPSIDTILEIGPGLGTLSDSLCEGSRQLFLIEFDKRMVDFLETNFRNKVPTKVISANASENLSHEEKVVIFHNDALQIVLPTVNKIISNIPYQISGPLMLKILKSWQYERVIFMVQREFAEHVLASPNSDNYSRISAAVQLFVNIEKLRYVSANCFFPQPRVESVIIKITAKSTTNPASIEWKYREQYWELLRGIFPYKNKSVQKAFGFFLKADPKAMDLFPFLETSLKIIPIGSQKVRTLGSGHFFALTVLGVTGDMQLCQDILEKTPPINQE